MFDHVMIGACDLVGLGGLYHAGLAPLGLARRWQRQDDDGQPGVVLPAQGTRVPTFFVQEPSDRAPASAGNGCMVAFLAPSPEAVREVHAAARAAGGMDEGAPGGRPRHGLGYCGEYLRDPEGNQLYVVRRGDLATG